MEKSQNASRRIDDLSQFRPWPAGFHEDRRSVYWENNIPPKDYSKTTLPMLTPRQEQLTINKQLHKDYVPQRLSPMWPIDQTTLTASCTPRLKGLARPKSAHPEYRPSRPVITIVPRATMSAKPTRRIAELARHKTYTPLMIKPESEWDWEEWKNNISPPALTAIATDRTMSLARPKALHQSYQHNKPVQWPIAQHTLTHMASERLNKLSEARQLSGYHEDYDPNTYVVSRAALLAQPSPRLDELATPLPRKCRTRK